MTEQTNLSVEVVYALPDEQVVLSLTLPVGASVADAINTSGILTRFAAIDLDVNAVGIFGQQVALNQLLVTDDRVEIYRPLKADPKETRRRLAAHGLTMGKHKR